jgi:hypothetical protein
VRLHDENQIEAWGGIVSRAESAGGARVTLRIYSGRPNPEFTLTDSESAGVRALAGSVPPAAMPRPQTPGLGYSGFQLTFPDGSEMMVYRDQVEVRLGPNVRLLYDENRALESELVRAARHHLGDDIPYDWIMSGQ